MNYVIAIISAILIARLSHMATEMRNSSLSAYIFVILYILARLAFPASSATHCGEIIHVCQLLFILSFSALFSNGDSYSTATISESVNSFITFMMLGIATMFQPVLFWFIPVYLCAQAMLRTLTPKSILAAGFGILVPWLWKWVLAPLNLPLIKEVSSILAQKPAEGQTAVPSFPLWALAILFVIYIIGVWHFNHRMYFDKSRTRVIYQVIIFFGLCTFLILFISSLIPQPSTLPPTSSGQVLPQPILYFIALIPTTLLIGRMADRMI